MSKVDDFVAVCMGCGMPIKMSQIGARVEGWVTDYINKYKGDITDTYCVECWLKKLQFGTETVKTAKKRLRQLQALDRTDQIVMQARTDRKSHK